MTWTPVLSATLIGTLVLVGAQNVDFESFRNSGFIPLNGAGSGSSIVGSGAGFNGVQGNFGGVGGAAGSGINRFGIANRAGYNYPVPANSLTLGGSAALGPAGGFLSPSTAPQLPGYEYGIPQGGQAALGGARGVVPVRQGNSGTLASTISQILQQLTGSQVSSVIGPTGGRNNLPIGNVNFFTASDPTESVGFRAPAPTFPVHNIRFLQPRTQTNAFVAIAPGQSPSAFGGQSALGGGLSQTGQQSFGVGADEDRNLEQPVPILPQPQALTFIPTPQQSPEPVPITPTLVAAPLPVGPAPAAVEPAHVPVTPAPVTPSPVAPAPVTPAPTPVEPAPAVAPLVSGGVPLEAVDPSSATTGINSLPTFGILLGSVPTSGFQTQGTNFGNFQGFNNLPIVDIANLGFDGQQLGGQQFGGQQFGGQQFGGQQFGGQQFGGQQFGGQQFDGLIGGTQGFQLAPGFSQSFGNDLNSFRNFELGAGAGGFGAGQNNIIGSGVGLQTGSQTGQGSVGTGLGTDGSFGVGLAPVGASGPGINQVGLGAGNGVSNLVIGSSGAGSTQGAGSGAAELSSPAEPGQAAETAGANGFGVANLRNLEQPAPGNPTQMVGVPLSLTGPQGPGAGLGDFNFRNLEQPAPVAGGAASPANEIPQTETNPLFIGLANTGPQQQIPGSVAADASQANVAIDSNIIGKRTLQSESKVQLFGVSLSETGPQMAIKIPGAASA